MLQIQLHRSCLAGSGLAGTELKRIKGHILDIDKYDLDLGELGNRKSFINKLKLAYLMKQSGSVTNLWLTEHLDMRHAATVSQSVGRFHRNQLKEVKKLNERISGGQTNHLNISVDWICRPIAMFPVHAFLKVTEKSG